MLEPYHVTDVEASLLFYVDKLGFTVPWRFEADGRVRVAQVDRQGCALILSHQWPKKVGKGLMFISLNVEPDTHEAAVAVLAVLRAALDAAFVSRTATGAIAADCGGLSQMAMGERNARSRLQIALEDDGAPLVREFDDNVD